jgi:uncharacterized tellurite resistance protein B-like protein
MPESLDKRHFKGARLVFQSGDESHSLDATLLISRLLVYTAKGDGSISQVETDKMLELLSSQLDIPNGEAMQHLSSAVMSLANDKEVAVKLRHIGEGLSQEEKRVVLSMVLDIAMADDELDDGEVKAVAFAGRILGIDQDTVYSELRALKNK